MFRMLAQEGQTVGGKEVLVGLGGWGGYEGGGDDGHKSMVLFAEVVSWRVWVCECECECG